MAVTLAQAATLSQNDLQRGVVETFVQSSVVLDRLPFMTVSGNAYAYNVEGTLPGVAFRAVNAAYIESTGTVNQLTETIKILGGDADVDRFIVQTRGNLNSQRAVQTAMKVKSLSYEFQNAFINGDSAVDANSFDGLKKRLVGAQVITAGTNGIPVLGTTDADRLAFLDQLDATIARVKNPSAIYTNAFIRAKMLSAFRRLNIAHDRVGDKQSPTYQGIPVLDIGTKSDGTTQILPQSETVGAGTTCSSVYVVGFGQDEMDGGVTGLWNGGIQVRDLGEVSDKPVYRTRIELYGGMAVFSGQAAARLQGVLNA
ncbi:MAG: hypothetical protein KDC33_10815 [Thermoleophilia bacterium]|nr:hypothetical protein [Thermoleophilia bacterium]